MTHPKWKTYTDTYRDKYPARRVHAAAKCRAKKRGMDFDLDFTDVVIPKECPILGLPLEVYKGQQGGRENSPSLDRIDNTKGYIKGNVQVISNLANSMKSTASPEQLKLFAEWILKTYERAPHLYT